MISYDNCFTLVLLIFLKPQEQTPFLCLIVYIIVLFLQFSNAHLVSSSNLKKSIFYNYNQLILVYNSNILSLFLTFLPKVFNKYFLQLICFKLTLSNLFMFRLLFLKMFYR